MHVPSADHAGWSQLLAAVFEDDSLDVDAPYFAGHEMDATSPQHEQTKLTVVVDRKPDVYA